MKKLICVFLVALLCCSVFFIPTSAAVKTVPEVPVIYVHGFMGCDLYGGLDTASPYRIWAPDDDKVSATIKAALLPAGEFAVSGDWDKLVDDAVPIVYDLLGESYCDENGEPLPNTGVLWEYPSKDELCANVESSFVYDWRLSPVELGQQLARYIDYVLECTGADKVALICHSYGNCVGMGYVAQFGSDKLQCFVFNASAFFGETYTGKLLSGDLNIDAQMLMDYINTNTFWGNQSGQAFIELLELLFIGESLADIANNGISQTNDRIASEVLGPWFAGWMSIWAMIPDEYYEACREYIFGENGIFTTKDKDYSKFIAKLDEYDRVVRSRREEIFAEIEKTNFGVVARYGLSMAPVAEGCEAMSDGTIDTKYASFGATCADYGKTLPDGYKQAKFTDKNYISPDNMIDASTCRYPDKTWFIKDMKHSADYGDIDRLFYRIIANDDYDIYTDEEYPQYLVFDTETQHISALNDETAPQRSLILQILDFFKLIKKFFLMFIA